MFVRANCPLQGAGHARAPGHAEPKLLQLRRLPAIVTARRFSGNLLFPKSRVSVSGNHPVTANTVTLASFAT